MPSLLLILVGVLLLALLVTAIGLLYWSSRQAQSEQDMLERVRRYETHRTKQGTNKPRRYDSNELARRLKTSAEGLRNTTPRYRTHSIPKRRGGNRVLQVPDPELKTLQRQLLRRVFDKLCTHHAATGFQPGMSIAHNAAAHVGMAVVIKMDLIDFFPSTSAERVEAYFRRIGWAGDAAELLAKLTTHDGGLPQGAPTSPRLSNLVNFPMDAQIDRWVSYRKGVYTRYADDITISFPKDYPKYVRGTIQQVRRIAKRHGYEIHTRGKLRVVRPHQQQRVTGLVVNEKVNLTREKRRWLRAVEHRMRTTGRASLTPEQLEGWKALQFMIEHHRSPP